MPDIEVVNPVPVEECRGWLATLRTTFLEGGAADSLDRAVARMTPEWDPARHWGVRADGRWVATLCTYQRRLTVPDTDGGTTDVTADALSAVTVNPTHRRRGLLRRMLGASLDAARERGDPFSVLMAAEWPIYGRFGYAPATREAWYTYATRRRGAALAPSSEGAVRQFDAAELVRLAPAVFEQARRVQVGQIDRPGGWWARLVGADGYPAPDATPGTCVVHEGPHGPDGLLRWAPTSEADLDATTASVAVHDLVAASPIAYHNLWAYLGGLDLVGEITLVRRSVDEPVRWLLDDGRALRQSYTGDGMWLRLLDVAAALTVRGYAVPGQIVLDVSDEDGGYAAGRYLLEAGDGGASCHHSSDPPGLRVTQRALAAVYLGAFSFRQLAITGGVEELVPGALGRADAMFATAVPPWNQTMF